MQTTSYSTANTTAGWDNTAMAMLTDFQCLTLTSWGYVMYRTMDATSPFAAIYFVILIVFGAYFVVSTELHGYIDWLKVRQPCMVAPAGE